MGIRARRGPYRSIRAALAGDRTTLIAPNSAMTVPATAYDPVPRATVSVMARETTPYDSRPTRAAVKVRRAWGMRRSAAYEGRADDADIWTCSSTARRKGDAVVPRRPQPDCCLPVAGPGGPYAKRRNMRCNLTAGARS
ncbi:hypothetical protein SAV31267_066650 [Streptomyces avermitilis]|uniref:Uncharacterized protein n=1 Tax=Streptomyces avermitilis TaxID=33903 RepID=A0A4D4MYB5_STRAX|nr:hypothetical protein SAVMC3_33030 [Streptomyces avermitilis]GDY77180.1 hypothetical protein SAV31267_066650 [Streptomyces avermitilis]